MLIRILCLLMSCGLWFTGCTNRGNTVSKQNETSTTIVGLTKVGELPATESTALALQCANEQICWLNTRKFLWQSVDGGKNWQEISRASDDDEINGYYFINPQIGFRLSFHKLYKSEDGGRTWTHQQSPIEAPAGEIRSLWFLEDGKTGWLAGGIYRDQTSLELKSGVANNVKDVTGKRVLEEAIFRTDDGGRSW